MKYIIAILFFSLMVLLSTMSFFANFSKSFFAGGSVESMMKIVTPNIFFQIFLLLIFGFAYYKLLKNFNVTIFILCIILFILWLMSGRTIGVFSDGKIKTGWCYFTTKEINICVDDKTDCETVTDYQTTVEESFFWRVNIKNKQVNQQIFVGPVVWYPALGILKEEFGSGKYTP